MLWAVPLLLLCWLATTTAQAQKIETISIALQTESVSLPFKRLAPIHPGIEIGVSLGETVKPHSVRRWNAYVGWFYHKGIDHSFYVRGEYQLNYTINQAVNISVPIGLGYTHTFLARPVYQQQSDGSFQEKTQFGRPHALVTTGLGISYLRLGAVQPFIKYEAALQTPFATTIPILTRNFLKIGSNIKLN